MGHCVEKGREGFAASCLKLLGKELNVIADELLGRKRLPIFTVGSRRRGRYS